LLKNLPGSLKRGRPPGFSGESNFRFHFTLFEVGKKKNEEKESKKFRKGSKWLGKEIPPGKRRHR
jgi:hypothetical protein